MLVFKFVVLARYYELFFLVLLARLFDIVFSITSFVSLFMCSIEIGLDYRGTKCVLVDGKTSDCITCAMHYQDIDEYLVYTLQCTTWPFFVSSGLAMCLPFH